ncbi:MAG: biotin/lipoate A/B protein ligase family protein [Rubripirellula sp.]
MAGIQKGRLIPLRSCGPVENMSIDQALLESVDAGGVPVLRMYAWSQPTLSIGYFQQLASRTEHIESAELACVRRATGGGAIVHDQELTYSIALPVPESGAGPRLQLYQGTHQAIAEGLSDFGVRAVPFRLTGVTAQTDDPFLCFQRRTDEDLIVSGYKVLGSAQRKTRRAVLQHGSLLLRASCSATQLPGIVDLTSRQLSVEELAAAIAVAIGNRMSIQWDSDDMSDVEQARQEQIGCDRFSSSTAWHQKR